MELASAWVNWIIDNRVALIEVAGILGLIILAIQSRSRGQALNAVVDGVATSGNTTVMKIIKEEFHDALPQIASYILWDRAKKAKEKQGIIKKIRGES